MSRDADAKNFRLFDRRTIERNIKKGLISRKDYEKYLKSLDDAKDKGVQGDSDEGAADEADEAEDTDASEAADAPASASETPSNSH